MSLMKGISIKSLWWYFSHPGLLDVCFQQIYRAIAKRLQTQQDAAPWYQTRAISLEDLTRKITGDYRDCSAMGLTRSSNAELLFTIAEHIQAERVIETGVSHGRSSKGLLLSLKNRNGNLISTDIPLLEQWIQIGNEVPDELKSCWQLVLKPDRRVLADLIEHMKPLDMCYYDSDKSYSGRLFAYPLLWEALRPGGIFVSDDISDNDGFRDFCEQIDRVPLMAENGNRRYLGVICK